MILSYTVKLKNFTGESLSSPANFVIQEDIIFANVVKLAIGNTEEKNLQR